jgi:4-hydroxybenzoate polyprenyltransferase
MSSDIETEQLIFKKIPAQYHPYIKLMRLDRPIGIWLLLFPCWWSVVLSNDGLANMDAHAWKLMGLMAVGAILMRSAGCIVNDLMDRKLDASVERTKSRPLASGEISVSLALRVLYGLLGLSLLVLIQLSHQAIILGVLSLGLVAAYPFMKRITWWPQLFLGLTFNWGALLGWSASTGHLNRTSFFLYAGGILWTLSYDTIYAHQDKEDDATVGIKSTARLFGQHSQKFVFGFFCLSLAFLLKAKYAMSPSILTPLLTSLPFIQAIWQLKTWEMNDPESSLQVFKSNQFYGWLVLLMLGV